MAKRATRTDRETRLSDMNVARSADTGKDFGHPGKTIKALASFVPRLNGDRASFEYEAIRNLSGLTFEVTGRRRHDARARLAKMYRVPPTGPWWRAVGSPVDRRVRPLPRRTSMCLKRHRVACHADHCCVLGVRGPQDYSKRGSTPAGGDLNKLTARRSTPARSALDEHA